MKQRKMENARRLAFSIECISEDPRAISILAKILNYYPDQLKEDMKDLFPVLTEALNNVEIEED